MKFYHFGNKAAPVILLLPGTCCQWKSNFGEVIPLIEADFHVVCVSRTTVYCFYAAKMGDEYLPRYQKHFKNPVIHHLDMEHEELESWSDKIVGVIEKDYLFGYLKDEYKPD